MVVYYIAVYSIRTMDLQKLLFVKFRLLRSCNIHKFSVFRSNRCSRWLKAYDRESTVVYKFFAYRWFQSWEMFLIFRFSWSILWSFAVTVFSGLFSDNDGDERPMLSLLSRGSLLWMNLGGTSFQFPSAAKESFWFCFDIFFEKSVHKRVILTRRIYISHAILQSCSL